MLRHCHIKTNCYMVWIRLLSSIIISSLFFQNPILADAYRSYRLPLNRSMLAPDSPFNRIERYYTPCTEEELELIDKIEGIRNLEKIRNLAARIFPGAREKKKVLFVTATGRSMVAIRKATNRVLMSECFASRGESHIVSIKDIREREEGKQIYAITNNASVPEYLMRRSGSGGYVRGREGEVDLLDDEKEENYKKSMRESLEKIESQYNLNEVNTIILDDVFPLGLIPLIKKNYPHIKLVWVNHRDYSGILEVTKRFFWKYLKGADMVVGWSKDDFPDYPQDNVSLRERAHVMPVAGLNPLDCKNVEVTKKHLNWVRRKYGISAKRKVIFQMGRFALIKDFYMTVRAYVRLKQNWPDSSPPPQLVLASPVSNLASAEKDMEEAIRYREHLIKEGVIKRNDIRIVPLVLEKSEDNIKEEDLENARRELLWLARRHQGPLGDRFRQLAENLSADDRESKEIVNHLEVNAMQRIADLGVHASMYESFGMVITEMLWKGKPVISARTGGIPEQYPNDMQKDWLLQIPEAYKQILRELQEKYKEGKFDEVQSLLSSSGIPDPAEDLCQKMYRYFNETSDKKKEYISKKLKGYVQKKYLILNSVRAHLDLLEYHRKMEELADMLVKRSEVADSGKLVVGLTGPIGVGKSQFASHLAAAINRRLNNEKAAGVLQHDMFFYAGPDPAQVRRVKWDDLIKQIKRFRQGEQLTQPILDEWKKPRVIKEYKNFRPQSILIVEGGNIFKSDIVDRLDLDCKIALDAETTGAYKSYLDRKDARDVKDKGDISWRKIPDETPTAEREKTESEIKAKKKRYRSAVHYGRSRRDTVDIVVTKGIDVVPVEIDGRKDPDTNVFRHTIQQVTVFTDFARGVCATTANRAKVHQVPQNFVREFFKNHIDEKLKCLSAAETEEIRDTLHRVSYQVFEALARPVIDDNGEWKCNDYLFCFAKKGKDEDVINICNELLIKGREELLCKALIEAAYILVYGEGHYLAHYNNLPQAVRVNKGDLDELIEEKCTPTLMKLEPMEEVFLGNLEGIVNGEKGPFLFITPNARGGGITEVRQSLCPALNKLGIENTWVQMVRNQNPDFDNLHDAMTHIGVLTGNNKRRELSANERKRYKNAVGLNMKGLIDKLGDLSRYECIFLDDNYSAGLIPEIRKRYPDIKIVWICHGAGTGIGDNIAFLNQYLRDADLAVFWYEDYIPDGLACEAVALPYGGINPLSYKNRDPGNDFIEATSGKYGLCEKNEDLILLLGRFDLFKDPLLAIASFQSVYKKLKKAGKNVQLAIAGLAMSPFTKKTYDKLKQLLSDSGMENIKLALLSAQHVDFTKEQEAALRQIGIDPDSLTPAQKNALEVNALQRKAVLGLHPTEGEAFGLIITEFLHKGTPVLASCVGGIPRQIIYDQDLFMVPLIDGTGNEYLDTQDALGNKIAGVKSKATDMFLNTNDLRGALETVAGHRVTQEFGRRIFEILTMQSSVREAKTQRLKEHVDDNFAIENAVRRHLEMLQMAQAVDQSV